MKIPAAQAATVVAVVLLFSKAAGQADHTTEFSQSHAAEHLRVLALDIGPRPMGSPAEQFALEYAVQKLTESGCDTAYIMPMRSTQDQFRRVVNTESGIAIGIQRGTSGRVIVLGAHIDSAGPEIPGANDDASGVAVVLELARALAQRHRQSTLVFALFGGEEMGLRGSELFVEEYSTIDSVMLMIQVDMADASPTLLILADVHDHNSPSWLVHAAFEEFAALGYDGLTYVTHFNTFSSLFERPIASSDHEPFMRTGIPAIALVSDVAAPIHTPQDDYSRFRPEGLKRTGDLVYRLVERFDEGVPEPSKEQYWLYQLGTLQVFVPRWQLWIVIGIAVGTALLSVFVVHNRTGRGHLGQKIRFSGGKLFVVLLFIMALVRGSEVLLGLLKGWRHPWFLEPHLYRLLAALVALLGVWIGIHLARRMKLSPRINAYLLRSVIPLAVLTLVLSLVSVSVAFYAASALFLVSIAFLVKNPVLRTLFWAASPYLMIRLLYHEEVDFMARAVMPGAAGGLAHDLSSYGIVVLGLSAWLFPFLTSFVGIYKESGRDLLWVNRFKEKWAGGILALITIGYIIFLVPRPTYSDTWRRVVHVDEDIDLEKQTSSIWLKSSEYLKDVNVAHSAGDTVLAGWNFRHEVRLKEQIATDWLRWERSGTIQESRELKQYDLKLRMKFSRRPYRLQVTYRSDSASFQNVHAPLAHTAHTNRITFSWHSFPDTIITVPVRFELASTDSVLESITATFAELAYPLQLEGKSTNFIQRTTVRTSELLRTLSLTNSTNSSASTAERFQRAP